tara:strand:+ start:5504 stop:6277 length:774 start_codon:yes stop_codon:yes gene_type:complete
MPFLQAIKIYDTPFTKIRLGGEGDGGYVVLDEICQMCDLVYSYGVERDVSFEKALAEKYGTKAILFDHTIEGVPEENNKFTFVREGVASTKSENLDTLESHLKRFGDTEHKTLKMDVEWGEWEVFNSISQELINSFDQIICEFHIIPVEYKGSHSPYFTNFHKSIYQQVNQFLFDKYKTVLDKLQRDHYVYHVHVNNSLGHNLVNGERIPNLLELSFVNKKYIEKPVPSKTKFPIDGLDFPNKTDRPDVLDIVWNTN